MTSKARIAAIDAIANEFLAFTWQDQFPTPEDLKARHERMKAAVESCDGGFDAWSVCALFSILEEKAGKEIANLAALAQATEPERLRNFEVSVAPVGGVKDGKLVVEPQPAEQRELPEKLIKNVAALKKHHENQGVRKTASKGGDGKAAKSDATKALCEIKKQWLEKLKAGIIRGDAKTFAVDMHKKFGKHTEYEVIYKNLSVWKKELKPAKK